MVINFLPRFVPRFLGIALVAVSSLVVGRVVAAPPSGAAIAPADEGGLLLGTEPLRAPEPDAAIDLFDAAVEGTPGRDPLDGALRSVVGEPLPEGFPETIDSPEPSLMDGLLVDEMPEEVSSGGWFGTGQYYGSAELVFLNRGRNYRKVIGFDSQLLTLNAIDRYLILKSKQGTFTTDSLPYNVSPGARITVGEFLGRDYLDRDRSVEVTYYGGFSFYQNDGWNAVISPQSQTYLVTPLSDATPGFTGAQQYLSTSSSNFNSIEANFKLLRRFGRDKMTMVPNGEWARHAERGWLPAIIVGARLANYNETFSFSSRAYSTPLDKFSGDYLIQTQNWLLGLNLGGELISRNEFFYWGLRGRGAPAIAFDGTQQQMNARNNGYQQPNAVPAQGTPIPPLPALYPTVPANTRQPFPEGTEVWKMAAQQVGPGFLGDLTCLAGWNMTPNSSIQVGYDILWVAGVATATRQFSVNKTRYNQIDPGGQSFMMGFSFGYNQTW